MAFIPRKYNEGKNTHLPAAASTTFTKGEALIDNGSGYIGRFTTMAADIVEYVAAETLTTGSTDGELLKVISTKGVLFEADTDADPAQTDAGTFANLATISTVDPNGSTAGQAHFQIESIKGAVGDRKILGYFRNAAETSALT